MVLSSAEVVVGSVDEALVFGVDVNSRVVVVETENVPEDAAKAVQEEPLVRQYPLASVADNSTVNAWLVVRSAVGPVLTVTAGAVTSNVQVTELVPELFPRASSP